MQRSWPPFTYCPFRLCRMAGRVLTKRERDELKGKPQQLADLTWLATKLLEKLGLYTAEVYARSREDIVKRQSKELLELSTPVVELWEAIILLQLIGTLDSERSQTVMENLLNHIVKSRA